MKIKYIAVLICMLLIATVLPVSGTVFMERTSKPTFTGDTLYVGGSGPNNYTSIQKAVNDAERGDTVFVYDDSSPYYTSARVRTSINLIGENKHTTILRRIISDFTISISADNVLVTGFNIENGSKGIIVNSNYNTITDNIISSFDGMYFINSNSNSIEGNIMDNSRYGIRLDNSNNNIITGNEIKSGMYAIWLDDSNDNTISENNISGGKDGILIYGGGDRTNISQNHIYNSGTGICLSNGNYDIVSNNYLLNNDEGIYLSDCYKTNIINNEIVASKSYGFSSIRNMYIDINRNNFIDNDKNAYFCLKFNGLLDIRLNKWVNNYWGEAHNGPYKIYGTVYYRKYFPLLRTEIEFNFTWHNFDWKPAQEPYDIGV